MGPPELRMSTHTSVRSIQLTARVGGHESSAHVRVRGCRRPRRPITAPARQISSPPLIVCSLSAISDALHPCTPHAGQGTVSQHALPERICARGQNLRTRHRHAPCHSHGSGEPAGTPGGPLPTILAHTLRVCLFRTSITAILGAPDRSLMMRVLERRCCRLVYLPTYLLSLNALRRAGRCDAASSPGFSLPACSFPFERLPLHYLSFSNAIYTCIFRFPPYPHSTFDSVTFVAVIASPPEHGRHCHGQRSGRHSRNEIAAATCTSLRYRLVKVSRLFFSL